MLAGSSVVRKPVTELSVEQDLPCRELVEIATDYLEGAMPAEERARLEAHLRICDGCTVYLDQLRTVIRLSGGLGEESLSPEASAALREAFRAWKRH
jgi:anti-sigma factor RsiW